MKRDGCRVRALLFLLLAAFTAGGLEFRPFHVRETTFREVRFRDGHVGHSQKPDLRDSRSDAQAERERRRIEREHREEERRIEREAARRERELQQEIIRNEREQQRLEHEYRQWVREWEEALAKMERRNKELTQAVETEQKEYEEIVRPPACAHVGEDGQPCRNDALPGQWFCSLHEDPPLPVRQGDGAAAMFTEDDTPVFKAPVEPGARAGARRPRRRRPESKEDEDASQGVPELPLGACCLVAVLVIGGVLRLALRG